MQYPVFSTIMVFVVAVTETDATHQSKQLSPAPIGSPSNLDPSDPNNPKTHSTPMTLKWYLPSTYVNVIHMLFTTAFMVSYY